MASARERRIPCSVGRTGRAREPPRGESAHYVPLARGQPGQFSRAKTPFRGINNPMDRFRPERKLTRDFTLTFDRSSSSEKSRVSEFICRGPGCMLVSCKLQLWQTDKHAHTVHATPFYHPIRFAFIRVFYISIINYTLCIYFYL